MPKQLSVNAHLQTDKDYKLGKVRVTLPHHECDVILVMPHGEEVQLQYRLEQPSLDVVMPIQCEVTTYDNVEEDHCRSHSDKEVQQVAINLPPEWLEETQVDTISLFPDLTPEQMASFTAHQERKQHLEYLAAMMLQDLRDRGLSEMIRNMRDEDLMEEFFGVTLRGKHAENPGCFTAENHTVPSLLEDWQEATNRMMMVLLGRE